MDSLRWALHNNQTEYDTNDYKFDLKDCSNLTIVDKFKFIFEFKVSQNDQLRYLDFNKQKRWIFKDIAGNDKFDPISQ